jgi:hypothetical protein
MRDGGVTADQLVTTGTSRQQAEFHVISKVNHLGTGRGRGLKVWARDEISHIEHR